MFVCMCVYVWITKVIERTGVQQYLRDKEIQTLHSYSEGTWWSESGDVFSTQSGAMFEKSDLFNSLLKGKRAYWENSWGWQQKTDYVNYNWNTDWGLRHGGKPKETLVCLILPVLPGMRTWPDWHFSPQIIVINNYKTGSTSESHGHKKELPEDINFQRWLRG